MDRQTDRLCDRQTDRQVLIQKMNHSQSKENDISDIYSVQMHATYVDNFLETRVGLIDI